MYRSTLPRERVVILPSRCPGKPLAQELSATRAVPVNCARVFNRFPGSIAIQEQGKRKDDLAGVWIPPSNSAKEHPSPPYRLGSDTGECASVLRWVAIQILPFRVADLMREHYDESRRLESCADADDARRTKVKLLRSEAHGRSLIGSRRDRR